MVSQVADVVLLFEGDRKRRRVVHLASHSAGRLRATHKVILVVTDSSSDAIPVRTTL